MAFSLSKKKMPSKARTMSSLDKNLLLDIRRTSKYMKNKKCRNVKGYRQLLKSVFLLKVIATIAALTNSLVDIGSDVLVASTYYNGLDAEKVCLNTHNNVSDNTTFNSFLLRNQTHLNFKFGPKESNWFILTVIFVFGPPFIRLCMINVDYLLEAFMPCLACLIGRIPKRGFLWLVVRWTIKASVFPIFPVLIAVRQFRKVPLMFKIEQRETQVMPTESARVFLSKIKRKTIDQIMSIWHSFMGNPMNSTAYKRDDFENTVADILEGEKYKESSLCKHYEDLSDHCNDHFFESFIESGPQTILQICILFQLCRPLDLLMGITILTSFASLAFSVVDYEINTLKKNPAKREPTFLGMVLVFCVKAPAIASRCLGLALLFSIYPAKVKLLAVVIIISITLIFAGYEYTFMHKEKPTPGTNKLIIHLLTKGYIANFTLLNFRTTYYDFKNKKWKNGSDEKDNCPRNIFIHQFWYYVSMMIVNIVLVIHPLYHLPAENQPVYFNTFGHFSLVIAVIVSGAPLSILFAAIFERFKDSTLISKRFGVRAMDGLQTRLRELIETDKPEEFQNLLGKLNDSKLTSKLLNMEDIHGRNLFDYLEHHHSSAVLKTTQTHLIACYGKLCDNINKKKRLLEKQVNNVHHILQYSKDTENAHGKYVTYMEKMLRKFPEHCKDIISVLDQMNLSNIEKLQTAVYFLRIRDSPDHIQFTVSKYLVILTRDNDFHGLITAYNELKGVRLELDEHFASKMMIQDSLRQMSNVDKPADAKTKAVVTCIAASLGVDIDNGMQNAMTSYLCEVMEETDRETVSIVFDIAMEQFNEHELGNNFDEVLFLKPCIDKIKETENISSSTQIMKMMSQIKFSDREYLSELLCHLVQRNRVEEIIELISKFSHLIEKLLMNDAKEKRSMFYDAVQAVKSDQILSQTKEALYCSLKERNIFPVKYMPLPSTRKSIDVDDENWPGAFGHVSFAYQRHVYLWTGGQKYEGDFLPTDHIWMYDPENNRFRKKNISGDIPKPRQFAAVGVIEDTVMLFGGTSTGSKHENDLHILNLLTMECQRLDPKHKPSPRRNMSTWVWKSKFYIWRGWVEDFSNPLYISEHGIVKNNSRQDEGRTDQLLVYADGDWTAVETNGTKPSSGNCAISPVSSDGKVYTIGGHQVEEPHTLFQLDLNTMQWSRLGEFPGVSPLSFIRDAVLVQDACIVIPVGHFKDNGVYKIDLNKWSYDRILEHPQDYQLQSGNGMTDATVTYIDELKQVFVFGGIDDVDLASNLYSSKYSAKNRLSKQILQLEVL